MGLFRQDYWSGQPFPTPGFLPDPMIELASLYLFHCRQLLYCLIHQGCPIFHSTNSYLQKHKCGFYFVLLLFMSALKHKYVFYDSPAIKAVNSLMFSIKL